jgi:hypothetical protein
MKHELTPNMPRTTNATRYLSDYGKKISTPQDPITAEDNSKFGLNIEVVTQPAYQAPIKRLSPI